MFPGWASNPPYTYVDLVFSWVEAICMFRAFSFPEGWRGKTGGGRWGVGTGGAALLHVVRDMLRYRHIYRRACETGIARGG